MHLKNSLLLNAAAFQIFGLVVAASARADFGPPAYILELTAEQRGQDVVIELAVVEENGSTGSITRIDPAGNKLWSIDKNSASNRTVEPSEQCSYWHESTSGFLAGDALVAFCLENPDTCVNCNNDGSTMCYGACAELHTYRYTDTCAAPGTYTYRATVSALMGGESEETSIVIDDFNYASCSGSISDTDVGTETETGTATAPDTVTENPGSSDSPSETSTEQTDSDVEAADADSTASACSVTSIGGKFGNPNLGVVAALILGSF